MTVRFWQRLLPLAYDASGLAPVGMRPVMAVVIRPLSRSLNVALASKAVIGMAVVLNTWIRHRHIIVSAFKVLVCRYRRSTLTPAPLPKWARGGSSFPLTGKR
jgi:hypothetical protein